ncbi:hypothetical protein [Kitasatospora paranensis]|uniref:hypothetical protein n=1 Tax=Kitasatospora paranensis TaxID=258053 RepID=UPI0031EEE3E0
MAESIDPSLADAELTAFVEAVRQDPDLRPVPWARRSCGAPSVSVSTPGPAAPRSPTSMI